MNNTRMDTNFSVFMTRPRAVPHSCIYVPMCVNTIDRMVENKNKKIQV